MLDWMERSEEMVIIERGEGCWLVDTEGERYLDGISSLWCNVHGHSVGAIDRAVTEQLDQVAHSTLLGLANVPSIQLARRLVDIAPSGLTRVFYSDAGATAVEAAVKMAFQYMAQTGHGQRTRFAALGAAYHGDTMGSVSLGDIEVMHGMFDPLRFDTVRLPSPYCYRCPMDLQQESCAMECADEAERILEDQAESLVGVVIEPLVQGAAGIITQPEGYLRRIAVACKRLDLLLIADEVATGFGRTGTLFACTQEQVIPDLLCLAKGLSGGYLPLAATLASERIFTAFLGPVDSARAFLHGHTYTGNPVGCAAALASLDLFQQGLLDSLQAKVEHLGNLLTDRVQPLAHVGDVRRRGLMVGIELVRDRQSKEPYPSSLRVGHQVILEARRQGVIVRPLGDVVVLMPPLAMDDLDLELLVDTVAQSIRAITEGSEA
jgi:adenosylmethionine-8-amino-7-oxononanoate aminotransferase